MENLGKSWNFKVVISRPGKVMEMCYNHLFIYTEFEISDMFFKERRSKYKPAYALNTHNVLHCSCLYRDFSLVMEICLKVMEIHWSKCVRTLFIPIVDFCHLRLIFLCHHVVFSALVNVRYTGAFMSAARPSFFQNKYKICFCGLYFSGHVECLSSWRFARWRMKK